MMNGSEFSRLINAIGDLSARQIEDLQKALSSLGLRMDSLRQIESRSSPAPGCDRCGSGDTVRWGRNRTGLQRWRCNACGATRSATTGTAVATVRRPHLLHALILDMFSGKPSSCREAAKRLGMNKMTVWRWRRLILRTLLGLGATRLTGIVEADETFQRESRKGSREWVRHQRAPNLHARPPRPRWRDYRSQGMKMKRGLSRWQVPILTACDRGGQRRAEVIPNLRHATIVRALAPHVDGQSVLCSDAAKAYARLATTKGLAHKVLANRPGARVIQRVFHIQTINALHARFKSFIGTFRGPATKNLALYVAWFLADCPDARDHAPAMVWDRMMGASRQP